MASKCKASLIGWHNYQARYNTIPPDNLKSFKGGGEEFERFVKLMTKKEYVYDICTNCGDVILHKPL